MQERRRDARAARDREALADAEAEPLRRLPAPAAAALSLLPALIALVLVQAASPAAQAVPAGTARFDLAASWLAAEPGALAGASWAQSPAMLGRLQLGLLLRGAQAMQGASVLAAAQLVLVVLAVLQALLLWLLLRRLGLRPVPAGLAVTAFAIAPAAVVAHGAVSTAAVAIVWATAAALLATASGRVVRALAGVAAVLALASYPIAVLPLAVGAVVTVRSGRRTALASAAGAGAALVAVLAVAAIGTALPVTDAARALDAVTAAQPGTTAGAAAVATWATADPLGSAVALIALAVAARHRRGRPAAVAAVLVLVAAVWPAGADAAGPLVVVLPVVALAVALTIERAVVALVQPVLSRSLIGSGWLTGVGALLLVAVVVALTGLPALVPRTDRPVARAERWLAGSVPAGQVVLVGLGTWPDLSGGPRAAVGWYAGEAAGAAVASSAPWSAADYVVADASLAARPGGAAGAVLARSVPVARFGSGDARLVVRAVRDPAASPSPSPSSTPPTTPAERRAQAARVQAGEQLAANPRIELTGQDRALLGRGRVDRRIALVLAQFATAHRVTVASFDTAAGDRSGVRTTVLISRVDGRSVPADVAATGDLLRFLSALRGDFATRSIDATDDGVAASFPADPDGVPSS